MTLPAYAPVLKPFCDWINAQTVTLVGRGNPLALGAHHADARLRSPGQGAYVYLSQIASVRDPSQAGITVVTLSGSVYGMTEDNAYTGAIAYAAFLDQYTDGADVRLDGVVLLCADDITGPTWVPDGGEPRYLVDATCSFTPS